ncbi:cytochrome P450 CYP5280A1P [Massarina eburnea CBS 473.64]|uniref:Cytochrome P450 CYP5280A1P n=1 Tax=Massarina eburnea CBS 473.64 TaxID=1395130 RepID=A0A6A6RTQ2_9PLEO|nr:cytochrome P450 CYP5280A1P [Massarina eburnea CBS 473.64]
MIQDFSTLLALSIFVVALLPIVYHFYDPKGFRKYPTQNWLSGISYLGYCWEVARNHEHFHSHRLHEAHKRYPVMRVGPNWLSFTKAQAAKDIYGYTSSCSKAAIYDSLSGGGRHLVNITEKSIHSGRRRMMAAAYAPRHSEKWEKGIAESMANLLLHMDERCTGPLNDSHDASLGELGFEAMYWSNLYTYEVIIKIGLSQDMGWLKAGNDLVEITNPDGTTKTISAIQCLHAGSRASAVLVWDTQRFPLYKHIAMRLSKSYAEHVKQAADWRTLVTRMARERTVRFEAGEALDDLFEPMMVGKGGEKPDIHDRDRIAEVDQMINGGGDGPAISLTCTLYHLIKNPAALGRLREELDDALGHSDGTAPWSKVRNLEYLKACIDESMRLLPPVATDLLRKTAPEGLKVDTEMVPGNTIVSVSAYSAHRDPDVFDDPETFRPERWLIRGEDKLKEMRAVYIPFSLGTRACIGRNITTVLQTIFLSTLIKRYEFALPNPDWEMEFEEYFNLWPIQLPLRIWRRATT